MLRRRNVALLLVPLLLLGAGRTWAEEDDYLDRQKPGRCRCDEGQATWEYLRSPLARPEDPVRCGLLLSGGSCAGRPRPEGTSAACWGASGVDCFWRRHAFSWQIRCSRCLAPEACPACDGLPGATDAAARGVVEARVRSESASMDGDVVVAVSPHFYVVTNVPRLKLRTKSGGFRYADTHEVAHLFAQRCEQAYSDFLHWYGGPIVLPKPTAVYVVERRKDAARISARYFGDAVTRMNYAFNYSDRIAEGFSGNGLVVSEEERRDDNGMHGFTRHMVGHILFSCWILTNGFEDRCPVWAWVGAAHFLEKLLPIHEDFATFCAGETRGADGPHANWPKRAREMVKRNLVPIETFFNKNSLSDLEFDDHLRAWSLTDLMLREDRDRWLALLRRLRAGESEATAFQAELGIAPEPFHEIWVERLTGKRSSMAPPSRRPDVAEETTSRDLAALREPAEPTVLAGRVRGLDAVADGEAAAAVLPLLESPSDLVRETVVEVLLRTTSPQVRAYLRAEGLGDGRPLVRAGVLRVLGTWKDRAAHDRIEPMLDDRHWRVRANAAWALQQLGDPSARPLLERHLSESDDRAWIAVADACAAFPGRSQEATRALSVRLSSPLWQVRLSALLALRVVGTADAMDALVERFLQEDGRLKQELYLTLREIAHDDLGPNPNNWRAWWAEQKKRFGGLPPAPPTPERNPADDRYGPPPEPPGDAPHYYGRRFHSRSLCYVLDTSGSMKYTMHIRPAEAATLGSIPTSGSRMEIARAALLDSLHRLDPRTRIRMVFFASDVRLWQPTLLPASPATVDALVSTLESVAPDGETNFHGALKAALGLHEGSTLDPDLGPMPDTVFFLTDGRPTRGEITSMPELTSWLRDLNRFAKIRLHVIALGELNVDIDSLRALAAAGDGDTLWVRER